MEITKFRSGPYWRASVRRVDIGSMQASCSVKGTFLEPDRLFVGKGLLGSALGHDGVLLVQFQDMPQQGNYSYAG